MNKSDWILIIIVTILASTGIILYKTKETSNIANVYYKDELILKLNLSVNDFFEVMGDNGKVIIEVNDNKVRVNSENSPYNICSKQGYISKKNETIICLPNRVIIEIPSDELDVEVK